MKRAVTLHLCRLAGVFLLICATIGTATEWQKEEAFLTVDTPAPEALTEVESIDEESVDVVLRKLRKLERGRSSGENLVHIATLKGEFGHDIEEISVLINGEEASGVILHEKALSFIMPADSIDEKQSRTFKVEIAMNGETHTPSLDTLALGARKVDFVAFRKKHDPSQSHSRYDDEPEEDYEAFENDESNIVQAAAEKKRDEEEALLRERMQKRGDEKIGDILRDEAERGNSVAMTRLGAILLSGDSIGMERDVRGGVDMLKRGVAAGNADAQALLAFLHASGAVSPIVSKNTGYAILLWQFASQGGSQYGKMALAFRLFTGLDVSEDCDAAARMYEEVAFNVLKRDAMREELQHDDALSAATNGEVENRHHTRLNDEVELQLSKNEQDYVEYHMHAARRGDATAMIIAGNLYYNGEHGVARNLGRARAMYERASKLGNMYSHARLGFMDLKAGDNRSAYMHFAKAAETGNEIAHHGLGMMFMEGIFVDKNAERAIFHLKKAATKKVAEAMYKLGLAYIDAIGVERDTEVAYEYIQEAAKAGHLKAQYIVGRMSLGGISPAEEDCALASRAFKSVAEQGVWNSILGRALRAFEKEEYEKSVYRYMQAAHAGIEVAQFNAAYIYDRDLVKGVTRTFALDQALDFYKLSAGSGSSKGAPLAMLRLGDMLYREREEFEEAATVYERAARFKNAEALFNLGIMHAFGRGLAHNPHLAKRYFDQAKEADKEAILPASIALFALRFPKSMHAGLHIMSQIGSWAELRWQSGALSGVDPIIIGLLAALAIVVNARQHMARRRVEEGDFRD